MKPMGWRLAGAAAAIAAVLLLLLVFGPWAWTTRHPKLDRLRQPSGEVEVVRSDTMGASAAQSDTAQSDTDQAPNRSMRSVPSLAAARPDRTYQAADWPELPATSLPVLSVFETLRSRALKGDAGAACRLAFDLTTCRSAMPHRARLERGQPIPNLAPLAPIDADQQKVLMMRCQGLDERHLGEQYAMLKQAALGGHELSLGYYLSGEWFRRAPGRNIDFLDDYRTESPRIFEAALQQGSVSALAMSTIADLARSMPFLPPSLQDNPQELESLQIMATLVRPNLPFGPGGDTTAQLARMRDRSLLTEAEFAAAEVRARQRAQAWYGDPARAKALGEFVMMMGNRRGSAPDPNRLCQVGYLPPIQERQPVDWEAAAIP